MSSKITDSEFVILNTSKHLPHFVVGQLNCRGGTFTIQPILPDAVSDLEAFCLKGKFLNDQMKGYIQNSLEDNPLSIYAVRSRDQVIQAILCLKAFNENRSLMVRIYVDASQRNQQIGTAIWSWAVEQLFPTLIKNNVQIGETPLLEASLSLKKIPKNLGQKAIDAGFTYDESTQIHSIAIRTLLKVPPKQEEEKGEAATENAAPPSKGWLGGWWT